VPAEERRAAVRRLRDGIERRAWGDSGRSGRGRVRATRRGDLAGSVRIRGLRQAAATRRL